LYGFEVSDFDDVAKFSRVGLSVNVADLFQHHLLIKEGSRQSLGGYAARCNIDNRLGLRADAPLIDQVHRAMFLFAGTDRNALLNYVSQVAASPESTFWRVLTSLCEVLPKESQDFKQATGLLANKDSLIREAISLKQNTPHQGTLDF
jgi:hypothetical protein